jgi:hypothetical protein
MLHRARQLVKCIEYRSFHCHGQCSAKGKFPHEFSTTEPLVPPSKDGSTPMTDSLPRSPLLDPTTYGSWKIYRKKLPPLERLTPFEKQIQLNPFGYDFCIHTDCQRISLPRVSVWMSSYSALSPEVPPCLFPLIRPTYPLYHKTGLGQTMARSHGL